jgi:hypothetical protein
MQATQNNQMSLYLAIFKNNNNNKTYYHLSQSTANQNGMLIHCHRWDSNLWSSGCKRTSLTTRHPLYTSQYITALIHTISDKRVLERPGIIAPTLHSPVVTSSCHCRPPHP